MKERSGFCLSILEAGSFKILVVHSCLLLVGTSSCCFNSVEELKGNYVKERKETVREGGTGSLLSAYSYAK